MDRNLFSRLTQTSVLSPKAQQQIRNVYLTLASTIASAMVGFRTSEYTPMLHGFAGMILILLATLGIYLVPATPRNLTKRTALLWANGWLTGASIAPFVYAIQAQYGYYGKVDLVYSALGCTFAIFAAFSIAVMVSKRSTVVYLVGSVLSALCALSWVHLIGFFMSPFSGGMSSLGMELAMAFASSCAYICLYTQSLVDQAALGLQVDPVSNALGLFSELVRLFINVLVALVDKRQRDDDDDEDRRRDRRRSPQYARRPTRARATVF